MKISILNISSSHNHINCWHDIVSGIIFAIFENDSKQYTKISDK